MYDLDKFKEINDTFGHQIGDTVLRAVAGTVLNILKKGQILGRVGGEEFIVLLPNTEKEQALIITEKIRKQVEAYLVPLCKELYEAQAKRIGVDTLYSYKHCILMTRLLR